MNRKSNKMECAPNEDSNQPWPWHPSSLIRVFAARLNIPYAFTGSYPLSLSAPYTSLNFSFVWQSQSEYILSIQKQKEINHTCTPTTATDNCVISSTCNALLNCKVFTMTHAYIHFFSFEQCRLLMPKT